MKIPLRGGGFTEVDDCDAEIALSRKWRRTVDKRGRKRTSYAAFTDNHSKPNIIYLHREILQAKPGDKVDHRDGNGLNNRRENLRLCTQSQNRANSRQWKPPKSGYRGVYPRGSRWYAAISNGDSLIQLGVFDDRESAARAYDAAAVRKWGEFARLNFPTHVG